MDNDVPFSGLQYSGFTGKYYAPTVEPACYKEPYYLIPVPTAASGQAFAIPTLRDYPMSCDALMDNNGVFLVPTLDFDFPIGSEILTVSAYLQTGNQLELLSSPNPASSVRTGEYYYIVSVDGANQQIAGLPIFPEYLNTQNFNITINGVLTVPRLDFEYESNVLTILAYLQAGDIVGILPAAQLSRAAESVPSVTFFVTQSGSFQTFIGDAIPRYLKSSDAIVTLNGINLQPSVSPNTSDFSITNPTLSSPGAPDVLQLFINPYIEQGSTITILCNTQSCTP